MFVDFSAWLAWLVVLSHCSSSFLPPLKGRGREGFVHPVRRRRRPHPRRCGRGNREEGKEAFLFRSALTCRRLVYRCPEIRERCSFHRNRAGYRRVVGVVHRCCTGDVARAPRRLIGRQATISSAATWLPWAPRSCHGRPVVAPRCMPDRNFCRR